MNSILRNVVLLKVPLHKIKPTQLNVQNITRSLGNEAQKASKVAQMHANPLRTCLAQSQGKPSLKISHKFRRDYSKKTGKNADQLRQVDMRKKKQRDEVHTDHCMTIKDGRMMKRRCENQTAVTHDKLLENEDYDPTFVIYETDPIPDIKEVIAVNNKIRHKKKERSRLDRHFINKIFHPITKREKKPLRHAKKSEEHRKLPTFKPLKKYFSTSKRVFSKHEAKKRQFQREYYEDAVVPEEHRDMYPYFVEKLNKMEAKKKGKSDTQRYPLLKSKKKESLPLFMIVKEMSEKSKGGNKNLVYKVCNNMATFNEKNVKKPVLYDTNLKVEPKRKLQKTSSEERVKQLPKLLVQNPENFFFAPEKYKDRIANFNSLNSGSLTVDDDYKEKLTRTIRYLLQPVIEQEYMKYNELRLALERMEKNMDTFFKQTKNINEQDFWGSRLEVKSKQNDFINIFDKSIREIRDPTLKQEIKDPLELKNEHKDPTKRSAITAPSYRKKKIQDPKEYRVMIAKNNNDGDNTNKNKKDCKKLENPCKKLEQEQQSKKEKEDSCKKEALVCKEDSRKKEEHVCKQEGKTADPFKKAKSKAAIFISSESCEKPQTSAEPVDPFKKSKSRATSFMPQGTENFFNKRDTCDQEEPVDPFKRAKSKTTSFYPPGGADRKERCDEGIKEEPVDPFKRAKSKATSFYPPGGADRKERCDEGIKDHKYIPFKMVKHKKDAFVARESCEKEVEPCMDPCKHQIPCTSQRLDKDCPSVPDFGKTKQTVYQKKMQLPCSTDYPKPKEMFVAKPPPPPVPPKKKCPPHTVEEQRYCQKPEQQQQPKVEPAPKGWLKAACRAPPTPSPPPRKGPRFLEPRQYEKKTWTPVKLKGRKSKTRKSKSEPTLCRTDSIKSSASKADCSKKGFLDGCKGLFASICKVFCPGKSGSGKKGAAIGAVTSHSMPELRTYSQYKTDNPGDCYNKGKSKKKTCKNKYPWKKPETPPCMALEKFFKCKSKEKFHAVKKLQVCEAGPLPLCEQAENKQKTLETCDKSSLCDQVMKKKSKQEECPKKKTNKKRTPHKLCIKMSAFGDTSKRMKCFRASQNRQGISSKTKEKLKASQRQYSQFKSSRSSKIRKKYPWTAKIERETLEDCSKESLITKLAMKKQAELELEEKAMRIYYEAELEDATASKDEEQKLETEKNVTKDIVTKCDKGEGDLQIFEIIKTEQISEKETNNTEVNAKNEGPLAQPSEDWERKQAALCQSEELPEKAEICEEAKKSKYQLEQLEKPKVIPKDGKCLEKSGQSPHVELAKPAKYELVPTRKESPIKCEEKPKTSQKVEKCLEKSDQSLQKQCVELCVTPSPVKKIPYTEEKDQEKCSDSQSFICEVKKVGNCEQLVCRPMKKPQSLCNVKLEENKEPKAERVLQCKVVHDDCNKPCLVCKEIYPNKESEEEVTDQIEKEEKKCKEPSKHKKRSKIVVISKKLVCKEEVIPTTEARELTCKPMEVREIKGDKEEKQKKFVKVGRKVSPFTYQDLLKKSEEVRREAEEKMRKKNKNKKSGC